MRTTILSAAGLALAVLGAGCSDDESALSTSPVELTESGACGDAYFWAATKSGDIAVTVHVEARNRSTNSPTEIEVSLPDPAVNVNVLEGRNLARNFCTDLPDGSAEPRSTQPATRGEGEIILDPTTAAPSACGDVGGTLRLTGLVAEDGTSFEPVDVASEEIGCYSG